MEKIITIILAISLVFPVKSIEVFSETSENTEIQDTVDWNEFGYSNV